MPGAKPAGRFYRPELDILRFGAFLMVFVAHTLYFQADQYARFGIPALPARMLAAVGEFGSYGVDVFFTLSSYLITTLLLREYRQCGSIDLKAFYARRILRIWPLYFAFLFVVPPVLNATLPRQHLTAWYLAAFLLLCGNWACTIKGYPSSAASPLWSVSIEEQFYLAWPFIMSRWIRRLGTIAVGMLVVGSASRLVIVIYRLHHPLPVPVQAELWCNTFARLDPIALGALVALWLDRNKWSPFAWLRLSLGGLGLALIYAAAFWGRRDGWQSLYAYPLVAMGSAILILGVLGIQLRDRRLVRSLAHLGKISYGLYVFHDACLAAWWKDNPSVGRALVARLAAFLTTIVLAMLSYRYLESPFSGSRTDSLACPLVLCSRGHGNRARP